MLNAEDVKNSPTCGTDHQIIIIIGDEDDSITFKWKLSLVYRRMLNTIENLLLEKFNPQHFRKALMKTK